MLISAASTTDADSPPDLLITDSELIADGLRGLGSVELALERPEAALPLFNEELKIRRREAERRPLEAEPRIALARAYAHVADCFDLEEARTRDLALTSLERAVAELRRLPAAFIEDPQVAALLERASEDIARILELSE